jgi:hypothetical protein
MVVAGGFAELAVWPGKWGPPAGPGWEAESSCAFATGTGSSEGANPDT